MKEHKAKRYVHRLSIEEHHKMSVNSGPQQIFLQYAQGLADPLPLNNPEPRAAAP